jgi:hypothetical protein
MGDLFESDFQPPPNTRPLPKVLPSYASLPAQHADLDINTVRGQISLEQERRAAAIFEQNYPSLTYIGTQKDGTAAVDAVVLRERLENPLESEVKITEVFYVAEAKCRDMSLRTLTGPFHNEWLVTASKLERGRIVALLLRVPLIGCLYLNDDDLLLLQHLADARGQWVCQFRVDKTLTQATINGGEALRDNAFINMTGAVHLRARS